MLFVAIPKYTQFLDQFNWWVTGPTGSFQIFRTQCFTAGPEATARRFAALREVSPGSNEDAVELLDAHHRRGWVRNGSEALPYGGRTINDC